MTEMKLQARDRTIDLNEPMLMGILNVTPDSFSGDGVLDVDAAVKQAVQMVAEGAGIIDVGGESSRPGATSVSARDELARVLPVVERLVKETTTVISVDTTKPEVAEAVLAAGAHMINDITGLRDETMAGGVARYGAGLVIMHMQGDPANMQVAPHYDDVVAGVGEFFQEGLERAWVAGVRGGSVVLDPGIGFGKTVEHNLALLKAVPVFRERFAHPLLIGVSRKGFIGKLTGRDDAAERVWGTVALTALAVRDGANILRVHDVAANRDAVVMARAVRE